MSRTRTISVTVNKISGDVFDSILTLPPKIIPNAKITSDGWWNFIRSYSKSKLKFHQNKSLGVLDHEYVDQEFSWNIPICVISNCTTSEIIITLKKPAQLSDLQFDQRVSIISNVVTSMKNLLES